MSAIGKYLLFMALLIALVSMAVYPDMSGAVPRSGAPRFGKNPAGEIPSPALAPSHVLNGLESTGAIDYRSAGHLTATGEEERIRLWQLPDEKPVLEINAGQGFQVLQVRFVPGKEAIAGCGRTAEGQGSIRLFHSATGKPELRIDDPEPVLSFDFDRSGRYMVFTAMNSIKVWDLAENQAVSIFPRNSTAARGIFFQEDRYVLQSDTLSLYDWKNGKNAAGLEDPGPVDGNLKKINDNLCAWLSARGLHTIRSPYRKREFIPIPTQGIYAFDLASDGKWGLFLKENKTMSQIDCATGITVKTIAFKIRPEVVFINNDGTNAYIINGTGNIEIFDIGNENIFRNLKFHTTRFFTRLWGKLSQKAEFRIQNSEGRSQKAEVRMTEVNELNS